MERKQMIEEGLLLSRCIAKMRADNMYGDLSDSDLEKVFGNVVSKHTCIATVQYARDHGIISSACLLPEWEWYNRLEVPQ